LSFDLLCRLSSLDLIQGFPKLKFEKDLICHPCRHDKMVAASHSLVTKVMTLHHGEFLHTDTVGPAMICSFGGKWYVLVVVDDFSRYSWVFFMAVKNEAFTHARELILRLQNEFPKNAMRVIHSDNDTKFKKILILKHFVLLWDSSINFPLHMCPSRMTLLNARIRPLLRWPRRCLIA
jgi:hypothetical protein